MKPIITVSPFWKIYLLVVAILFGILVMSFADAGAQDIIVSKPCPQGIVGCTVFHGTTVIKTDPEPEKECHWEYKTILSMETGKTGEWEPISGAAWDEYIYIILRREVCE